MNQLHLARFVSAMLVCGLSACNRDRTGESLIGRSISQVEIRYAGERTVDERRLRNFISSNPGDSFTPERINSDVKSLYESGLVDDVRFLIEPDGDSVRIIAEVSTRPSFGPPFCIGNTAYSDKRLAEASGLTKEHPITVDALEEARQKLTAFYFSGGYVDAEVVCRAFQGGVPSPEDFIFVVDEGSKVPQGSAETKEAQQDAPEQPLPAAKFR